MFLPLKNSPLINVLIDRALFPRVKKQANIWLMQFHGGILTSQKTLSLFSKKKKISAGSVLIMA